MNITLLYHVLGILVFIFGMAAFSVLLGSFARVVRALWLPDLRRSYLMDVRQYGLAGAVRRYLYEVPEPSAETHRHGTHPLPH